MAGGYARTKKGRRIDLPGVSPRSGWEADLLRVLLYLRDVEENVTHVEYEQHCFKFPGKDPSAKGNKVYYDDLYVTYWDDLGLGLNTPVHSIETLFWPGIWLEVKGRLKVGGRLDQVDLSPLDNRYDKSSRIKLERLRLHYPKQAQRTWLIGEAEWHHIRAKYKPLIAEWESR